MSEKQRTLPPWMTTKDVKVKEKTPLKTRRKKKAARATLYCMNEAELVEAAVSCLTDDSCDGVTSPVHQQVEKQAKDTSTPKVKLSVSLMTAKPLAEILEDESSDRSVELEYVSETDLDVAEVETLPYATNLQHPEAEKRSGAAQGYGGPINTDLNAVKETKRTPEGATEEDDALQLVREIFFT
ncbi:cell cycle regulator of non-homologous end joining [Nematolebias whitei]|uniref:cell cycle regulator of non-homologous end joining n=1 Tax=Nematolebias whitei TaxID=451745 RepID=UPI001898EA5C|nr:cell cycle regulator of non-homologous end joining [Nematolebias whitei]